MMDRTARWLTVMLALALAWFCAPVTWAHGGPPRLELGAQRTSAGTSLDVRGINIAADLPVTLRLVDGMVSFRLASVIGDHHGDFAKVVMVPREAAAGVYRVRA